jgi:AraC-like DNA-binding protein
MQKRFMHFVKLIIILIISTLSVVAYCIPINDRQCNKRSISTFTSDDSDSQINRSRGGKIKSIPDSLLVNVRATNVLQYTQPERCLKIIDEIERLGNDTPFNCEHARMNCYVFLCRYHEMIDSGERCLKLAGKYTSNPDEAIIDIFQSLATACSSANFYDRSMHYAQRGIDYAEEVGNHHITVGYLHFMMSRVLNQMGYTTDALRNAVDGYEISKRPSCDSDERHRWSYQTAIVSAIMNLCDQMNDYDSALKWALECSRTIKNIRSSGEMPASAIDQIENGNKIKIARLLHLLGQSSQADSLFHTIDLSLAKSSKSIRQVLMRYYSATGDYRNVYRMAEADIAIDRKLGDTLTRNFIDNITTLAEAENALGNSRSAFENERHALDLKKREQERIIQSNALELSIIYDVHNKEKAIRMQQSRLKLYLIVIVAILLIAIVLGIKWSNTRRRNKQMVKQIQQLQQLKKERADQLKQQEAYSDAITDTIESVYTNDPRLEKIYSAVVNVIEKEELFLSTLSQDDICLKIGYNRNLIAQSIHLYRNVSLTRYIIELRLVRATELLAQKDKSIESVAEESGFGSLLTLVRNFKQSYGMTPAQYRRLL